MPITYQTRVVTTATATINNSDEVVFVNYAGKCTLTLPTVPGEDKRAFYIKDYSGQAQQNPIFIVATNKTIDGAQFAILNVGYSHIQVVYDGSNWKTLSS